MFINTSNGKFEWTQCVIMTCEDQGDTLINYPPPNLIISRLTRWFLALIEELSTDTATEITLHCVLLHLFRYLWLEPTLVVLDLWSEVTFIYVSNLCDRDIQFYRASVKFQKQSGEISYWWCEVTEECYTSACLS